MSRSRYTDRSDAELGRLAQDALRRVLLESHRQPTSTADDLYLAARDGDREDCLAVVGGLIASGEPAARIMDMHLPDVARRLGADWAEDRGDFLSASIGCANLASLLPHLERLSTPRRPSDEAWVIQVRVPRDNEHRFGITILAAQLRRRGHEVSVVPHGAPDEGVGSSHDLVLISASGQESVPDLQRCVASARKTARFVVLGGPVTELRPELCDAAGADLVSSDVDEVLRVCGESLEADARASARTQG